MISEKDGLLLPQSQFTRSEQPSPFRSILVRILIAFILFRVILSDTAQQHFSNRFKHKPTSKDQCIQFPSLFPTQSNGSDGNEAIIFSEEYKDHSVGILSGLVQIHRESFDDEGEVGLDPRWNVFYNVASYLSKSFPELHETLELEKINTHGLVYTWKATDTTLKPLLLMAHQDTVPVNSETIDKWTHPPWSGHYDGEFMWGRGVSDCGNTLAAIFESTTLLIKSGFLPKRTVLFAFGFDEESKGLQGAGKIAPYLEKLYPDGVELIVDEGGLGIGEMFGMYLASPSTSEKGYLDVKFALETPGGHSSVPPPHTGIGILAALITDLESSPYTPSLSLNSPIFPLLTCAAIHGNLNKSLVKAIRKEKMQEVAEEFAEVGLIEQYLVSTSQAVDIIGGGVKVNALPETSFVVVNYRVSVDSNPGFVKDKIRKIVRRIGKRFNLEVDAFEESITIEGKKVKGGRLTVTGINELNPAPVSPTDSKSWSILSGTIQSVYSKPSNSSLNPSSNSTNSTELIVAPSIMTGNTDTRFMWNLSKDIYRFTPVNRSGDFKIHTVDEHLRFSEHISAVWFYHQLIRNFDESS